MDSEDNHSRPALKEIHSNETAGGTLSPNNQKQLPVKAPQNKIHQLQDNKQQLLDANNLCPSNELLNENNCSAEDERINKNTITGTGVVSSDLPALEFPLSNSHLHKIIANSQPSLEDSLVSSLAENFNAALALNATTDDINQAKSLSPPLEQETSSSHVSSDNETYVECRSFPSVDSSRFTSALDLASSITNLSPGWDDLVTSVTEMDIDSLENINVQLDVPLDETPTESVNPGILNLLKTKPEGNPAEKVRVQGSSIHEERGKAQVESINLDVTTCMTPETVALNVASVVENVDSNSCLGEMNDAASVNTTAEGKSPSQNCYSTDTSATGDEYCSNITVEADHILPAENNSISSDNNGPISSADVTQESNQNNSVVLSWAAVEQTVEKISTSNCSVTDKNITHDLDSSSSPYHLHLIRSISPQPEPAGSPPADSPYMSPQFPVRNTLIQNSFPKCPTTFNAPKEIPHVPIPSSESVALSPSDSKLSLNSNETISITSTQGVSGASSYSELNSDPNRTIDIVQTSPNGTTSQPSTSADSADLPNRMNSTFSASTEVLNATTTVASKFDETFDDTSPSAKTDRRSLSPALSNQTNNIDQNAAADNNQTTDEPMDVDISSPNPNETVSYPAFPPSASSDGLSEKEKCCTKDEKDVFVDKCAFNNRQAFEEMFNSPSGPSMGFSGQNSQPADLANEEDFQSNRLFLNPSDFDFLLTKGNSNVEVDRSSLLLRFDPLLGHSVPVNQPVKAGSSSLSASSLSIDRQQQQEFTLQNRLSPTNEEEEHFYESDRSFQQENGLNRTETLPTAGKPEEHSNTEDRRQHLKLKPLQITARSIKKNAKMSVDVIQDMKIENDCKSIEQIDTQADEKQNFKMDELEKKIKNEVLKTEDIEKKLKEAEQREEALIKRITEKDKTIAKMNGVIEAYEKAIAELIAEKEQIIQNYEKQLTEVKTDRDSNYHHLTSLETTFSDLHVKYEKSKEMTAQLKSSEESLLAEKRQNLENLRLQEQRYEKMKNHAMQQLEMANNKLESLTKNHTMEITKLKALLKKEEISRASINEQLQQKSRENEELVKICDELISGQGS